MDTTKTTLTDEEREAILGRARALRAAALRSMSQDFGAWAKSRFSALKDAVARPVQTTA